MRLGHEEHCEILGSYLILATVYSKGAGLRRCSQPCCSDVARVAAGAFGRRPWGADTRWAISCSIGWSAFSVCSGCGLRRPLRGSERCRVAGSDRAVQRSRPLTRCTACRSLRLRSGAAACCCTCSCPTDVDARSVLASLRSARPRWRDHHDHHGGVRVEVEGEWHIFSNVPGRSRHRLRGPSPWESARELGSGTLFFPGCTLASYAPELTREVFSFLQDRGMNPVISTDCCGSPLKSGGLGERVRAYKSDMVRRAREAGIAKVVFACPGCRDEFSETEESEGMEFVALPRLLADAGVKIGRPRACCGGGSTGAMARAAIRLLPRPRRQPGGRFAPCSRKARFCRLPHCGQRALCCGAGGRCSLSTPTCARGGRTASSTTRLRASARPCWFRTVPCSYTFCGAAARDGRADAPAVPSTGLSFAFETGFDWDLAFYQLETMWSGEYGAWVCQQLLG